jgi:hypothetical protein
VCSRQPPPRGNMPDHIVPRVNTDIRGTRALLQRHIQGI